jgi:Tol biopolymer transport system component
LSSSPAQIASIELAWSPDGSRLAVVAGAAPQGHSRERPPELWLVGRDGQTQRSIVLGPDGPTRAPQWTTEGRFIIVNTFPIGGRRIIAVDSNSSDAWDLSEPRWDTFAMLMPDGKQLLLWNGRGGFWKAELQNE